MARLRSNLQSDVFTAVPSVSSMTSRASRSRRYRLGVAAAAAMLWSGTVQAQAPAPPVLDRGDAVVTGFSGIKPTPVPVFPGANPLDHFIVDGEGVSAQVLSLRQLAGPPRGQLEAPPALLQLKAREVGQVFAVTIDDGDKNGRKAPDIYLGQTSLFGLHIVDPDGLGPGRPRRLAAGKQGARWMPAQLGGASAPGTIWRVDGLTGKPAIFATLPGNSGAGIGDIAFDRRSGSFYASDLDSGLVHRIARDGRLLDAFDHGVTGRPKHGLPPLPDDGQVIDIARPTFSTTEPDTWGLTPPGRRIYGLAVNGGRLYYAVMEGQQIWSVDLGADGGFGTDARWELDAPATTSSGMIADILFDPDGRMLLARRGAQRAAYDFSVYAEPGASSVLRFRLRAEGDPPGSGRWLHIADEYATGLPAEHRAETGGIALGYGHNADGRLSSARCGAMLWTTGDRLRLPTLTGDTAETAAQTYDVHGLQGSEVGLVRPQNVPPQQAYFIDYDGMSGDAEKAGHVGDVEIWQPCDGPEFAESASPLPPGYAPPRAAPPAEVPPEYANPDDLPPDHPPGGGASANLRLIKRTLTDTCVPWGGGRVCTYRINIRNMGPDAYNGPLVVDDWLPAAPAGAVMGFSAGAWGCWSTGATAYRCWRPPTYMAPGNSVSLTVAAWIPNAYPFCHMQNAAALAWAPGGTKWNTNVLDDVDTASAFLPAPHCPLPIGPGDLLMKVSVAPGSCGVLGGLAGCLFHLQVTNQGPGLFSGALSFQDLPMNGATASFGGTSNWSCASNGPIHVCSNPNARLHPGETHVVPVHVTSSLAAAIANGCRIENAARIATPRSGDAANQNAGNDDSGASGRIPAAQCKVPAAAKALSITCPPGYRADDGQCVPRQRPIVPPGLPPTVPPAVISPPVVPPPHGPPVVPVRCPAGTIGSYPDCRTVSVPVCPEGTVGRPPNCRKADPPKCPEGTVGRPPNCRKADPPKCPEGTVGRPPNCRKADPPKCPEGTVGRPPNCRKADPPKCPEGTVGRPPNCRKVDPPRCPAGTVGRPPNCRKAERPSGRPDRPQTGVIKNRPDRPLVRRFQQNIRR